MSENQNSKIKFEDLVSNPTNYIESFRSNIFRMMDIYDYSLRELSEEADMPFETLKSFLYGDSKDCKLSTAVKIARAFHISIDEIVGAETIEAKSRESLAMARSMPDYVMYYIRSTIRHQYKIHSQFEKGSINIPVLVPECTQGYLPTTNITETVCIDQLTNNLKSKIVLGIKIPCEHYEPYYMPGEIVLLAADRDGLNGERCLVSYKGNYFFAVKRSFIENGVKKWKYVSLLENKIEILKNEIDDKFGYIVGFLNPDGTWGVR